jgi:hypothetical protein
LNEDGALFDSGFDDNRPFRVSPESGAVSLESALRDFGPAAIDDLIPRVRAIAGVLDAAHRAGVVHGALHPSKVFVTGDDTYLIAGKGAPFDAAQGKRIYLAPEVIDGHGATPMSDQYALAAITHEWLFGRPIAHAADRPLEVRSMPGVDRSALSNAFTRALAPKPEDRFASCAAFCDALNGAIVPELPLLAGVDESDAQDPAIPIVDEIRREPFDSVREDASLAQGEPPDFDSIDPQRSEPGPFWTPEPPPTLEPPPAAVLGWNPSSAAVPDPTPDSQNPREMGPQRFGALALILATIVGSIFGFAAGYMARPRALQSGQPQEFAVAPGTDEKIAGDPSDARDASDARAGKPEPRPSAGAPASPASPVSPASPASVGRLLVRSTPSGASVSVDGVARGVTPLALRELPFGTRDVSIERRGYIRETRKVTISKARPARTLEVRLSAEAASAVPAPKPSGTGAPRPGTPATLGKPAASATGGLSVDSRPSGASVTINGKPSGTTPLAIGDLAPGEYRIVMSLKGFRNFTTTVRVVAGERVRAAASLTALEQE